MANRRDKEARFCVGRATKGQEGWVYSKQNYDSEEVEEASFAKEVGRKGVAQSWSKRGQLREEKALLRLEWRVAYSFRIG